MEKQEDAGGLDVSPPGRKRALMPVGPVDVLDFQPALLKLQERPPSPLPRAVLLTLLALLALMGLWAIFGQLDIVAQAHGKLVPSSHVKIVQPSEQGVVQEILVREGDVVDAGDVLMRMDTSLIGADERALMAQVEYTRLSLRRVDAELADEPFLRQVDDSPDAFAKVNAQFLANRQAQRDAVAVEDMALQRASSQLLGARGTQGKLGKLLDFARSEEHSLRELERQGFATRLLTEGKARDRVELEQDLHIQDSVIATALASTQQSRQRIRQLQADYRRQLNTERVELSARLARLREERVKLAMRLDKHALRAPQRGIVKDIATHTPGTVVSPGTILMTLVPLDDELRAEVWVTNEDVGFIVPGQPVRLKLAPFQFQKYGMLDGEVLLVSADAADGQDSPGTSPDQGADPASLAYRTLVSLSLPYLQAGNRQLELFPGMRVTAEIHLGRRSVLEYVLSPVRKTMHDAAREK